MEGVLIILLIAKGCITIAAASADSLNAKPIQIQSPLNFYKLNCEHPEFNYLSLSDIQPHNFKPVPESLSRATLSPPKLHGYTDDFTRQYYIRDLLGQAIYGHSEPGQIHHAVQDASGNKAGSFSYYNPEGKLVTTNYIADAAGYRVSSNDLPIAPVFKADLPIPPQDTPEVAEAKAKHFAEIAKAQANHFAELAKAQATNQVAAPRNPQFPVTASNSHTYYNFPKVKEDGFLEDTPEVTAAKADHLAKVASAKAKLSFPLTLHSASSAPPIIPGLPSNSYPTNPSEVPTNFHLPMSFAKQNPTNYNIPRITVDGFLEDTPEVKAAKADHFTAIATLKANAGAQSPSLGPNFNLLNYYK